MEVAVAAWLAVLASLAFGSSDFVAGLASRRFSSGSVTGVTQAVGLIVALAAVAMAPGVHPTGGAMAWGAVSGVGGALGLLSLFHGFAVAKMTVVATVSAVLTVVIPVVVDLALGNLLSTGAAVGIAVAIPALGLVCWQPEGRNGTSAGPGLMYGALAGFGIALMLIGLDRAGTRAGAWPLVASQAVAVLLVTPFAIHGFRGASRLSRPSAALMVGAGFLAIFGNLLFLAASSRGQLAVVAALTALYPAATVVLARIFLAERWTRLQLLGLLTAAAALVLITAG